MRVKAVIAAALLAAVVHSIPAVAATHEVNIRDNVFEPQQMFIDVGDTVTWDGGGFRPHTVTSDTKLFDSGRMGAAGEFSFTFRKKGKYYYHCKLHGAAKKGMWGVIVVGDRPKDTRDRLLVPDDYPSVQEAVTAATPGAAVVIRPGRYSEEVVVETDDITIRGIDRFRTVLDGKAGIQTGIQIIGDGVSVKNLTVANYTDTGIRMDGVDDFVVRGVDLIGNRTFGVSAFGSHNGSITNTFAWGSGEAGIQVGRCFACGILIDGIRSKKNMLGVEVVNATGVTVRDSTIAYNGVGLLARSSASVDGAPGRGLFLFGNRVVENNEVQIPPAGMAETYGLPYGTGIWLAGVKNSVTLENRLSGQSEYGILITDDLENFEVPINNRTQDNVVTGSGSALDLAWDGSGENDCFDNNAAATSGPQDIQDLYPCRLKPFVGTGYAPVRDDVDAAIAAGPQSNTVQPPRPIRPRCQRGKPGCKR